MDGSRFKCGLSVCDTLVEVGASGRCEAQSKTWPVTEILDSFATNSLSEYSHGRFIDQLDWEKDLLRFEKSEGFKSRTSTLIVGPGPSSHHQTPKSILFMTPGSVYDGRIMYSIDNNLLFVHRGSVRVFYFSASSKIASDSQQTCSSVLASMTLIFCVAVEAGHHLLVPSGRMFIVQAATDATVVITRFLCGHTMKKQITSYRMFYNENVRLSAGSHD